MEKSRINDLFHNDKFIRFISIIIAIILWAYVSYVINPETQKQINDIPVNFINDQVLLNSGLILKNKGYSVNLEVSGRRNVVSSLNSEVLSAEIDLSRYLKMGTNRVTAKIEGIPASVKIIKDPQDIFIELSKAYSIEKEIKVSIVGETKSGYYVKNANAKPAVVTIEGEEDVINSISDVIAIVDVSNLQNTFITEQKLNIIDNKGNEVRDVKANIDIVEVKILIEKEQQARLEAKNENDI